MSKRLDFDPFQPFGGVSYDQMFDGSAWELHRGPDFELDPGTVVKKIRTEHARRFGELLVKAEGDRVFVKFIPPAGR